MRKKKIIKKQPTSVHTFRCTDEEYNKLKALAEKCGLSLSRYVVETGLEHNPRQRLTELEVHGLNSLAFARVDLIKITNVLAGKSDAEKLQYFNSWKFMKWWIDSVTELIQHWYRIEENNPNSVMPKVK